MGQQSEMMRYLGACVFWGTQFEDDPQHAPALERAGWLDEARQRTAMLPLLWEINSDLEA